MASTQNRFKPNKGIDGAGFTVINVADPVNAQDAATKNFSSNANNLTSGTVAAARFPAFTGDATTVAGAVALTLAASGVTAGTYPKVTVDAKGRVTAGAALVASDIPTLNQSTTGTAANVTGIVAVANGGTGSNTAATARTALGAAASGANTDITSLKQGVSAPGILGSSSAAVTAAGATQATATVLTSDTNVITTAPVGSGVVVSGAPLGKYAVIINRTANAVVVYPSAGHAFDGLATNIGISLPASGFLEMFGVSSSNWHTTYQAIVQGAFVTGNIPGAAAKLTTARAITLTGAVTGTGNFDGSAPLSITTKLAVAGESFHPFLMTGH